MKTRRLLSTILLLSTLTCLSARADDTDRPYWALNAESALYARIITEGLFGIRPTGLHSFTVSPRLPEAWPEMTLRHIRICGGDFDLRVYRDQKQRVHVQLIQDGKVVKDAMGSTLTFII